MVQGDTVAQAAEKLYISPGTAKTHVAHIYLKMGAHSRSEACELVRTQTSTNPTPAVVDVSSSKPELHPCRDAEHRGTQRPRR